MKYTINDFRKDYPNDAVCLDKIFELRYGKLEACPGCGVCEPEFKRITTRRAYQCRQCYHQLYPTAGTVFEKTRTPLRDWFFVMYLMTATRNGVAAKEVERQLGVSYKCAWRMCHQIRKLMTYGLGERSLDGFVETDSSLIGGKEKNKHKDKRTTGTQGMSLKTKTAIIGMVERRGEVVAIKVDDLKERTVLPLIQKTIRKSAKISTDEAGVYSKLTSLGYDHNFIKHAQEEYRNGSTCTNTIEGFFSQVKRTIGGSHIAVSPKYLQNYLNECCYRYNRRGLGGVMFIDLLCLVSLQDSQPN